MRILCLSLFSLFAVAGFAQFEKDYTPLASSGAIPADFYSVDRAVIKSKLGDTEGIPSYKLNELVDGIYYFKKEYFESGAIYLPNELTRYVDQVTAEVIKSQPEYKDKIKVYVTRSLEPNAYCLPDGTFYINIGLITLLESASELAFVIAHEIAHYTEHHALEDNKRAQEVRTGTTASSRNRVAFRRLQYSKEFEFDADGQAIRMLLKTPFKPESSIDALDKLRVADTFSNSDPDTSLLDKYFKNEYCEYDSNWITEYSIDEVKEGLSYKGANSFLYETFGDLLSTHPDLEKRQYALKEIIANAYEAGLEQSDKDASAFKDYDRIHHLAEFEAIENALRRGYYVVATYQSMKLMELYPNNIYLNTSVTRAMYWVSYYKEINEGNEVIREPLVTGDKLYFRMKSIIGELSISDGKKLAYGFSKTLGKNVEANETSLFYTGLSTEHYLGKNASFGYYEKYLEKYPNGQFSKYVKKRLKK